MDLCSPRRTNCPISHLSIHTGSQSVGNCSPRHARSAARCALSTPTISAGPVCAAIAASQTQTTSSRRHRTGGAFDRLLVLQCLVVDHRHRVSTITEGATTAGSKAAECQTRATVESPTPPAWPQLPKAIRGERSCTSTSMMPLPPGELERRRCQGT
jgi:hypothetical protein